MALLEGKTTAERNKTIAAIVLGVIALFFVVRMLFGSFFSSTTTTTTTRPRNSNTNVTRTTTTTTTALPPALAATATPDPSLVMTRPVVYDQVTPEVPSVGRNIFAFYVAPVPTPKPPVAAVVTPTPTPPPPPPLLLTALTPPNVFARTGDFALQVNGDKFTPQTRVYFNGQEVPTRYVSPQQLSANVPAVLIGSPGASQIVVRTPDNVLYSNAATLNISPPPTPDYTFVGVLIRPRGNDTAMLKNKKGELVNVQRGDLVDGRFRISSISAREVELTDQQLKIKHTLAYSDPRTTASQPNPPPGQRYNPPPQKTDEDEETEP